MTRLLDIGADVAGVIIWIIPLISASRWILRDHLYPQTQTRSAGGPQLVKLRRWDILRSGLCDSCRGASCWANFLSAALNSHCLSSALPRLHPENLPERTGRVSFRRPGRVILGTIPCTLPLCSLLRFLTEKALGFLRVRPGMSGVSSCARLKLHLSSRCSASATFVWKHVCRLKRNVSADDSKPQTAV